MLLLKKKQNKQNKNKEIENFGVSVGVEFVN